MAMKYIVGIMGVWCFFVHAFAMYGANKSRDQHPQDPKHILIRSQMRILAAFWFFNGLVCIAILRWA